MFLIPKNLIAFKIFLALKNDAQHENLENVKSQVCFRGSFSTRSVRVLSDFEIKLLAASEELQRLIDF
jgi:hypothetical protein